MDVYMQIRDGSNLILENVSWHVPEWRISSPINGRRVLDSIRCDNGLALQASGDRHSGGIDANKALRKMEVKTKQTK